MAFRINTNSLKNAMGTVFLLAAAFFVCSTLISIRTVFADPVVMSNQLAGRVTRISPRATTNRTTVVSAQPGKKTATSRGVTSNRTVASRAGGAVRGTNATDTTTASRGVVARNQTANNARSERAVRARTSTTPSRVSAAGTVMAGNRAGTTTSYSYLASSLYTGSYSNIIDSTTGLISADAYSTCMESYYTCMDEICSARSDTKGRCSCAGRATNFLSAETALEKANEELIKLSGQLSLLIATKGKGDDLAAAFSLTDAEKVMNCVSYKEAEDKNTWCEEHPAFNADGSVATCAMPSYCNSTGTGANNFGFDIKNIDGSSSDILAQLKAWADAKDLAKEYTVTDTNNLLNKYTTISGIVNGLAGITDNFETSEAALDSLANKWGYKLFEYAHNNVCGRVLDSCFNGIYEACGTPVSVTDSDGKSHTKCANGATSNCPFNYNSYISVVTSGDNQGDVKLNERNTNNTTVSSTSTCFGYTTTSVSTGTRSGTITSNDPYATLRGPVADARRSIMQKYLLDANAACDVYGSALKQTAQNINYQKIAAEQALQQKRLEFKQEEEAAILANASTAIDNFNECVSEIWDCYEEYADEENWTTARIKAYCSQISQVPHCYGTMICSPLKTQYIAVVDKPDNTSCKMVENGQMYDYRNDTCRNVVTISEILYGTGMSPASGSATSGNSAAIREACLQEALNCGSGASYSEEGGCLREWKKPKAETQQSSTQQS